MDETRSSDNQRAGQFTSVFESCYGLVLAYARRRVGADLAQDVVAGAFLAAWRCVDELPSQPLPWLYRAAYFEIASQRRALARRARLDDRARLVSLDLVAEDHSELVAADMELAAAFRSLSEADREVLRLATWEGLTAVELSEVIGCSVPAAKGRLRRARARLSRALGAEAAEPGARLRPRAVKIEDKEAAR